MRDDTPSRTAQWVAGARGLGRLIPEAVRIADDPYGLAFSSSGLAGLVNRYQGGSAEAITRIPGLRMWIMYMQVRTRVIDDIARGFVAAGGRQIVMLGAGYDCRALRLSELAAAQVYEIDHPATQGHKLAVFERLGVTSPAHYVTWDFETHPMDDLPAALAEAGHDPAAPSLTIWEGVTMYLTEGAIDASLRAITAWSAPGSELAMTYQTKTRLATRTLATRTLLAAVRQVGEPYKFGWTPEELPAYLQARGYELVRDVSIAEGGRELLPPDLAAYVSGADSRVARIRTPRAP